MDTIDVSGLPEPLADALRKMVQTLRARLPGNGQQMGIEPKHEVCLPVWPGKVIGSLKREDLYGDAL